MLRLISPLLLAVAIHASCPNGYSTLWKGKCVKTIELTLYGTVRNLTDYAFYECAKDGAYPAKVDNDEEVQFLYDLWKNGIGTYRNIIGVVCNNSTKQYHWADGSEIKMNVPCDVNTLYFHAPNMRIYSATNSYASEFNVWCYKPTSDPIIDGDCYDFDAIRESDGTIGSCAKVSSASMDMETAEEACTSDFSGLATIQSKQANDFIRRQATSMGYLNGILIGGTLSSNDFSWIDNSTVNYTNFAPGFPLAGAGSCVAMQTNSVGGQWINTDCSKSLPFACTRSPDAQAPACGTKVYKEGDIIYSPGYPKNASEPCDYELQVPERKIVQLEILNLEANSCCDHLTLHEETVGGRLIANLTGGNLNGKTFRTFASNIMHVSWQPNGGENVRGFSATFRGL